jgi:DNA-binding MarR family transcriptional regulator
MGVTDMGAQHAIDTKKRTWYSPDDFMEIRDNCVASNLFKATRIVGRIYDEAFRDVGISSPQFALLVSLFIKPGATATEIAESLGSDPSTVSRNTELLLKREMLTVQPGSDRRVRTYFLTELGVNTIQSSVPHWKSAQRRALRRIGRMYWRDIRKRLRLLSG